MQNVIIFLFCGLVLIVPIFTPDLYPFTAMPMFSDSLTEFSNFEVHLPDGTKAPLHKFGLESNYISNMHAKLSAPYRKSLNPGTKIAEEKELRAHLLPYMKVEEAIPWIRVIQRIIGPLESSSTGAVGIINEQSWKIKNPYYDENQNNE